LWRTQLLQFLNAAAAVTGDGKYSTLMQQLGQVKQSANSPSQQCLSDLLAVASGFLR
jgi:hypothetical protein